MSDTVFDKIVSGEIDAFKVWEDAHYLAFLTPFASTPGQTIVIPKTNQAAYVFDLSPTELSGLMAAVQQVAKLLEKTLGVSKVAMVFEGEGVAYVHAKLYPMHGHTQVGRAASPSKTQFFETYPGYISTIEGPKMSDDQLTTMQQKIVKAGQP